MILCYTRTCGIEAGCFEGETTAVVLEEMENIFFPMESLNFLNHIGKFS